MDSDDFDSQDDEHDWDFEDEEADPDECAKSLFDDVKLPSIGEVLKHDREVHGFDLDTFRKQMGMDEIETIMCINYIRSHNPPSAALPLLMAPAAATTRPWKDDSFMRPVLENDAFLLHDWEDEDVEMPEFLAGDEAAGPSQRHGQDRGPPRAGISNEEDLARENEILRSAVRCLAEYVPDDVRAELLGGLGEGALAEGLGGMSLGGPSTSGREAAQPMVVQKQRGGPRMAEVAAADEKYFDSYSHFGIHREMLSDKARTEAYRDALEQNPGLMAGARVLDVGCGTGILSMFAARGGATQVIGVDGSKYMAGCAQRNCARNGLESSDGGPVTILAGRVEDIEELPGGKVDVIVSEWMGYTLFFETMLDSVIHARDRWLKPGGAVLPDVANLYIAGASSDALGTGFWRDVYGFSMEPVAEAIGEGCRGKALVTEVAADGVITKPFAIRSFDLVTIGLEDTDFSASFQLPVQEGQASGECCALVVWFDVQFSQRFCKQRPVTLTTSPFSQQTHWAQTVLPLKCPVRLGGDSGKTLEGRISIARSRVHRSLDISLEIVAGAAKEMVATSYSIAMS